MTIAIGTITANIFTDIKAILDADSTIQVNGTLGVKFIGGTFPDKFITSTDGLPFIIIHKPKIKQEKLTFTKYKYPGSITIDVYANQESHIKTIEDGLRTLLCSTTTRNTLHGQAISFWMLASDDENPAEKRNERAVHSCSQTYEFLYLGGG